MRRGALSTLMCRIWENLFQPISTSHAHPGPRANKLEETQTESLKSKIKHLPGFSQTSAALPATSVTSVFYTSLFRAAVAVAVPGGGVPPTAACEITRTFLQLNPESLLDLFLLPFKSSCHP